MGSGPFATALGDPVVEWPGCVPVEEGIRGPGGGAGRGGGGVLLGGSKDLVMGKAWGTGRAEASSSPNWILQQWADALGKHHGYNLRKSPELLNL